MIRTAIVPIRKLTLRVPSFQVGKVIFYDSVQHIRGEALKTQIAEMTSVKGDDPRYWLHGAKENFQDSSVAVLEVENDADINDFRESAEYEIERSLNVLRLFISGLAPNHPVYGHSYMGLFGSTSTGITMMLYRRGYEDCQIFFNTERRALSICPRDRDGQNHQPNGN